MEETGYKKPFRERVSDTHFGIIRVFLDLNIISLNNKKISHKNIWSGFT